MGKLFRALDKIVTRALEQPLEQPAEPRGVMSSPQYSHIKPIPLMPDPGSMSGPRTSQQEYEHNRCREEAQGFNRRAREWNDQNVPGHAAMGYRRAPGE